MRYTRTIKFSLIVIMMIVTIGLLCISCEKKELAQSPPSSILAEKISAQFTELNINADNDAVKRIFGDKDKNNMDFSKIENFSVRQSQNSEIGIFKLYSQENAGYIKELAQKRVLNLQTNAYNLQKLYIANNGEVRSYGRYVYYAVHPEKDGIFKIIEDELKGMCAQ